MSENTDKINVRIETSIMDKKVATHYLLWLPEYKREILINPEYVPELIEKLTLLNKDQNEN